jgi:hypothetical protein
MISALLLAAAAAYLFSGNLEAWWAANKDKLPKLERKHVIAGAIAVAAAVSWHYQQPSQIDDGRPTPVPGAVGDLDLSGLFAGPTAADDAAALAALCDELAAAVEYDGAQDKPRLTTGWAIADLRSNARDIRLKGQTFGERQPKVRDAVKTYLDRPEILGKNGGPLSPQDRSRWVVAFRDVARAAEAAIQ